MTARHRHHGAPARVTRACAWVVAMAMAATISGCSLADEPGQASSSGTASAAPAPTPPPTPPALVGDAIDPTDTTWSGVDSTGDLTIFEFDSDGTVAVTFGPTRYDDPVDTWHVVDETLVVEIHLDEVRGDARYVGTWNEDTATIDAVATTTNTGETLTVALTRS